MIFISLYVLEEMFGWFYGEIIYWILMYGMVMFYDEIGEELIWVVMYVFDLLREKYLGFYRMIEYVLL